jgi:hypothetical protein
VTVSVPLAFCTTLVVVALLEPPPPPPAPEADVDDPLEVDEVDEVEEVDDVDEVELASVELLSPDTDVGVAVRLAVTLPIALMALNFDLRGFPSRHGTRETSDMGREKRFRYNARLESGPSPVHLSIAPPPQKRPLQPKRLYVTVLLLFGGNM